MDELKKRQQKIKCNTIKIIFFAKIIKGEIPCKKIYENDFVLSFS